MKRILMHCKSTDLTSNWRICGLTDNKYSGATSFGRKHPFANIDPILDTFKI